MVEFGVLDIRMNEFLEYKLNFNTFKGKWHNNVIDKINLIDRDKVKTIRVYNKMDSFSSYSSTERFSEIAQDHDINEAALFVEIKSNYILNFNFY